MKKYRVTTDIFTERQAFEIMSKYGQILSRSGGFPIGPCCLVWKGTEEGLKKLRATGAYAEELKQTS